MKKLLFLLILIIIGGVVFFVGIPDFTSEANQETADQETTQQNSRLVPHLSSVEDVGLYDVDGSGVNYAFIYQGEEFRCQYYYDNWTIFDSYKITNKHDMKLICQALIDTHPVHGSDMESYRTADDMAYEWQQHNLAYRYLPEDNAWRSHAENVDFDPADQGRSLEEMYEARTGQDIDVKEKVKEKVEESIEDGTLIEKIKNYVFQ